MATSKLLLPVCSISSSHSSPRAGRDRLQAVSYFSFESQKTESTNGGERRSREEGGRTSNLHNFTFSLASRGSEEKRTTACGLRKRVQGILCIQHNITSNVRLLHPLTTAVLAQSVERLTAEREVVGSIPGSGPILRVLK